MLKQFVRNFLYPKRPKEIHANNSIFALDFLGKTSISRITHGWFQIALNWNDWLNTGKSLIFDCTECVFKNILLPNRSEYEKVLIEGFACQLHIVPKSFFTIIFQTDSVGIVSRTPNLFSDK